MNIKFCFDESLGGVGRSENADYSLAEMVHAGEKVLRKFLGAFNIHFFWAVFAGTMFYHRWKPPDRLLWIQSDCSCRPLAASCTLPGSPLQHAAGRRLKSIGGHLVRNPRPHVCPFCGDVSYYTH